MLHNQNTQDFYNLVHVYLDAVLFPRAVADPFVHAQACLPVGPKPRSIPSLPRAAHCAFALPSWCTRHPFCARLSFVRVSSVVHPPRGHARAASRGSVA